MKKFNHIEVKAFTLVELLVATAIIAILAGLTIGTSGYTLRKAKESRTRVEIKALDSAIDCFKIDNGDYPASGPVTSLNPRDSAYINSAQILFTNLSGGKLVYNDAASSPVYMQFKKTQVSASTTPNHLIDPFGYAYGYRSDANAIHNVDTFDTWSTAGTTNGVPGTVETDTWISNWEINR